ncbi:FmdB family zinc ribbon protein [Pseudodesulfovibrio pelocollis]|uniref:FmdB family zinc ribbon protein n=1 Tax=Pseudodesulfovibrio pelocollis TaxID=3051432 RepID=UPI00255A8DE5|nr:zinc ribbon domain-containing protein [Pseudodesulfovibrio sp. SB368]
MPIYDVRCPECGYDGETIVLHSAAPVLCPQCGSQKTQRAMSATSSLTGKSAPSMPGHGPGPGDTGCCGSAPGHSGCAGPGSCCGRNSG